MNVLSSTAFVIAQSTMFYLIIRVESDVVDDKDNNTVIMVSCSILLGLLAPLYALSLKTPNHNIRIFISIVAAIINLMLTIFNYRYYVYCTAGSNILISSLLSDQLKDSIGSINVNQNDEVVINRNMQNDNYNIERDGNRQMCDENLYDDI
jgi:hypothetical protein